jgi:hypothetical protein
VNDRKSDEAKNLNNKSIIKLSLRKVVDHVYALYTCDPAEPFNGNESSGKRDNIELKE